jgi:hypothetical protein
MRRLLLFFIILWVTGVNAQAAAYTYDLNARCRSAYKHFMALHLNEGRAEIQEELKANPNNLMAVYIADYEDCLLLLLNGNKTDYNLKKGHFDERLELLSKGDEKDPWYKLCKGGIYLHWAMVHIRYEDNMKAAFQFRKSFNLLKENKKEFPDFDYNNIYYGTEQAVAGAIPDKYKWLASIFGIRGDVKKGTAMIVSFMNAHTYNDLFKYEAALFSSYLRLYMVHQHKEAWEFINSDQYPVQNNLLFAFVKANIALNTRRADVALQTLKAIQSDPYYDIFPMTHYQMGCAYFYKADPACLPFFQQFANKYKGSLFIKDAWQKMALMNYLQKNTTQATACRAKILTQGNKMADVDIQAHRFGADKKWPNHLLLYAHLLIDGGYQQQALAKLEEHKEADFIEPADKVEYNFRLARAYDELNNDNKAIQLYQRTINMGKSREEHFAARSALQMALIYERVGMKQEAIKRYNECLSMRNHDFQGAIDQQAKAGLNRMGQ